MKKFKLLLAVVVVFTLLSTFAMAANDTIYIEEIEYTGADSIEVTIKSNVTQTLTAIYGSLEYDPAIWSLENKTGTMDQYAPDNDGGYVDLYPEGIDVVKGEAIVTFTATCLDKEAAVGSTFKLAGVTVLGSSYSDKLADDVADYQTITVTGATADPIATEYTVGEKTYTSVPNKTFTDVAVSDLSNFGGNVTVTYEGGVNTYFTKAFTFGGLGTGSGTASFDVAVVGVPSNITVTDIAVAIN